MGVTGLWTVVAPTARPTQLASLNRKRLAVDASIWIYQFLKAVRDKEGSALRNSHVVGFFRRICKLLYFGIKPVFVFDGGAPILKRETIRGRARRREGRREDAARTAGKLLAVQVARAAEEEQKKRQVQRDRTPVEDEVQEDDDLVYVEEIGMDQKERAANRGFKRKDQYHLPDLDVSIESMGAPNDPRIMSQAELEEYARQFHSGEDVKLYDFSKIDFESPFFLSLPPGDRYNILNAARLRSRLRMGYSKEQLDGMFPDRMAFSRFQIERVKERNELTQRLMHVNGLVEDYLHQGGRVAGEKGKEYVLVKNDGVEGGWALGVVSNRGRARENAIDLDENLDSEENEDTGVEEEEEEDFEDIEIEGLNRVPKTWTRKSKRKEADFNIDYHEAAEEIARKRKAVYGSRREAAAKIASRIMAEELKPLSGSDSLFIPETDKTATINGEDTDELFEDVDLREPEGNDDEDLQRAIAMSLEQADHNPTSEPDGFTFSNTSTSSRREAAHDRSHFPVADHDLHLDANREETFDIQAALAEARKSKHKSKAAVENSSPEKLTNVTVTTPKQFDGPLPFESLNLGQSLLGKKKSEKVEEDLSGGFERDFDTGRQEKPARPVPSWFNATPKTSDLQHEEMEIEEDRDYDDHTTYGLEDMNTRETQLRRNRTTEVIDIDAPSPSESAMAEIITVGASDEESDNGKQPLGMSVASSTKHEIELGKEHSPKDGNQKPVNESIATVVSQDPPNIAQVLTEPAQNPSIGVGSLAELIQVDPSRSAQPTFGPKHVLESTGPQQGGSDDEESIDWSESEHSDGTNAGTGYQSTPPQDIASRQDLVASDKEYDAFEDVEMPSKEDSLPTPRQEENVVDADDAAFTLQYLIDDDGASDESGEVAANDQAAVLADEDRYLSDSDEELMRQLTIEAEEHARFASSLNNKTGEEAARDYENELKQLRNQQKKDRRDADQVTQTMVQECQALLRLFGLPYITAPMEAEAQCAELVHLGLVDGIVTDDSDIFLFGGTRVYKNMFNAAKFVECYSLADLEKEYALDRRKLIRFAHLLGSDYTEGIPGIGPVSALEILTDFSTLEEFKEWCSKVQLGRPQELENQLTTSFRRKFRNAAQKRIFLPPAFPDVRVDQAYLQPEVDSDPQPFQWGVPDLDKLRSFLMATIGWTQERTDEILVPVVRDMNKREVEGTQANITRFFAGAVGVGATKEAGAPRNRTGKESGRMTKAFGRLRGEAERNRKGDDVAVEPQDDEELANDIAEGNTSTEAGGMVKKGVTVNVFRKRAAVPKNRVGLMEQEHSGDKGSGESATESPRAPTKKKRRRKIAIE